MLDALAWTAEIRPFYDENGAEIAPEIARRVVRSDTGEAIAACGPNTALIQHQDVVEPMLDLLSDQGYDVQVREWGKHDLYDLRGKKAAWVASEFAKSGAIMRTRVITGDFTQPTGPSRFLPSGPPTVFREFNIMNSHNAAFAAQVDARYRVLQCFNGMARDDFSAKVRAKHTTGFDIEAFKAKVLAGAELMEKDTETFKLYIRTPCSLEQAAALFEGTIARLKDKDDGTPHHSEGLVAKLMALFQKEPPTVWGVVMAMTAYATHGDMKASSTELTTRIGRDEQVARVLRSKEFKQLLAA